MRALHDIGKVGLPDHILLKPGKLDAEERILMKTHAAIGAETLKAVMKQHGSAALAFLQMAVEIAPIFIMNATMEKGIQTDCRVTATFHCQPGWWRFVTCTTPCGSRRSYKPALSHSTAIQVMTRVSVGQFDPVLLQVLEQCAEQLRAYFS